MAERGFMRGLIVLVLIFVKQFYHARKGGALGSDLERGTGEEGWLGVAGTGGCRYVRRVVAGGNWRLVPSAAWGGARVAC
jgi:hypothetical protein